MVEMADLTCINDVQASLSAALQANDIKAFKVALQRGADACLSDGKMSIFESVCRTPGRSEFIKECLKNSNVLHKNSTSSKYPIHYAVESMDSENLSALLSHNPNEQINLEYHKRTPIFLLTEQLNGQNVNQCYECLKVMIKIKAINFNFPNENDYTPILNILMAEIPEEKRQEIVRFCFANANIDVDSFRQGRARKLVEQKLPGFTIPKFEANLNIKTLESYLLNDTEDKDRFYGAFEKYVSEIQTDGRWSGFLKEEFTQLLICAIEKEKKRSFDLILYQNEDLQMISSDKIAELLMKTCTYGQFTMLRQLLNIVKDKKEVINEKPLLCEVIRNVESTENENDGFKCKYFACFNILMENSNINVDKVDQISCPPIYYAIKYKWNEIIEKLLKSGAYIGTQTMFNKLAILEIDPDVLEKYLDSCIITNGKRLGDEEYSIIINFSCLIPPKYKENCEHNRKNSEEILPVVHIAQSNELKHLLKHPVIWSFIFLKWLQLSIFFYINLLFCSIFFFAIIVNLTTFYGVEGIESSWKSFWWSLQLLGALYLLIRELLQFLMSPLKHFKSVMNLVELLLIFLIFATLFDNYSNTIKGIFSAFTMLLIGFEYIFLIGSLPFMAISTHTAMLRTVSTSFLYSLLLYSIGIISFALAFLLLFRFKPVVVKESSGRANECDEKDDSEFNSFTNPFISILKTFVMLTGEFEAADIGVDFTIGMCVVFTLFVFFVPIVISNLINGLAVNDTQVIKSQAELVGLQQRVEVLEKYQQSVWLQTIAQKFFGCCYRNSSVDLATKEINIYPNRFNSFTRTTVKPKNKTKDEVTLELIDDEDKISCFYCTKCSPMEAKVVKYAKEKIANQTQSNVSYDDLKKQLDRIMAFLINNKI